MPAVTTSAMVHFTAQPRQPSNRHSGQIQLADALNGLIVDQPSSHF
jgi:hypothetical protein